MPPVEQTQKSPHQPVRVLLTAAEAYPAFEQAFLAARREIWAGFRIFDPTTALRSPEAKAVGDTWFDLIVHTLKRGVAINMIISDFDPVAWSEGHRATWRSMRIFVAAAEIAGPKARLKLIPAMHPARTGMFPRLLFWPMILKKLKATAQRLNESGTNQPFQGGGKCTGQGGRSEQADTHQQRNASTKTVCNRPIGQLADGQAQEVNRQR